EARAGAYEDGAFVTHDARGHDVEHRGARQVHVRPEGVLPEYHAIQEGAAGLRQFDRAARVALKDVVHRFETARPRQQHRRDQVILRLVLATVAFEEVAAGMKASVVGCRDGVTLVVEDAVAYEPQRGGAGHAQRVAPEVGVDAGTVGAAV